MPDVKEVVKFPTQQFLDNVKPYGKAYLTAGKRFRVIKWHRGSHKTTYFVHRAFTLAVQSVGLYWHIFPYLNEAVATVWKDPSTNIFRWIPEPMLKQLKVNHSDYSITFPNGSVWQLKGADKPDSLRGPKPKHIFVDEYGEIARRHGSSFREAVIEPSIRSSGGGVDYGGTSKGNTDFETLVKYGQTREDWWSSVETIYTTGIFSKEETKEILSNITNKDLFRQEYECEVIDGASTVFKGHANCIKGELRQPEKGHTYKFGIDLARSFDRTAIIGIDQHDNQIVYFQLLENQPWEQQKISILATLHRYNDAQAIIDATGVGDAFVEGLAATGASIYPFKITSNQVKRTIIERLAMYLENKYISYPDIQEIKDELNSFEYQITDNNNITYNAPSGMHDDIVLAMALVVQLVNPVPTPYVEPTIYEQVRSDLELDPKTGYWK